MACSDVAVDDDVVDLGAVTGDIFGGAMNALLQLIKWQHSTAIVAMDGRGIFRLMCNSVVAGNSSEYRSVERSGCGGR